MSDREKIFISYNAADDSKFMDQLAQLMQPYYDVLCSKPINADPSNPPGLYQSIRNTALKNSVANIVLIGKDSWKKKETDWEIATTIQYPRAGLVGVTLPTHPNLDYKPGIIPPRFHYNLECGYAAIYNWTTNAMKIKSWIEESVKRSQRIEPDDSYPIFTEDKKGETWL